MRPVRLTLSVLYIGYLMQAGLLMLVLPWSEAWGPLLLRLPSWLSLVLDGPSVRGLISGFGVLHLALVALEVVRASPDSARHGQGGPGRAPRPGDTLP